MADNTEYAARLEIDYPEKLDRLTTFFRILWIIPIAIILGLISGAGETVTNTVILNRSRRGCEENPGHGRRAGERSRRSHGLDDHLSAALSALVVRLFPRADPLRVPGSAPTCACSPTSTRRPSKSRPSTWRSTTLTWQSDLNRWMPLVKWFLAIPHYIVLAFLAVGAFFAVIVAWFAILFTGQYPRGLFDFVVGVGRWGLRVNAYAFLLVTDRYPPFSLR